MIDYACSMWRPIPFTHVSKLQVLQSKFLCIATDASWSSNNRQIHEDLGVPPLADHIISLTWRFDSKLADVGKPLVSSVDLYADQV